MPTDQFPAPVPDEIAPGQPNLAVAMVEEAEAAVSAHWRQRVTTRLAEQIDGELRKGLAMPAPATEQQALGIIKGVAGDLRAASQALFSAAEQLKNAGRGYQASQAHQAGRRAAEAAEGLIGA